MLNILFQILRRWLWLLLTVTLIAGGIGYAVAQNQPITYSSRVQLLVGPSLTNSSPDLNDLRAAGQLVETYGFLPKTRPFLQAIIAELNLDMTVGRLSDSIEITTSPSTQILEIRVTTDDPEKAALIANAIAQRLIAFSPSGSTDALDILQAQIRDQIARIEEHVANSDETIAQLERQLESATSIEEQRTLVNQISQERSRQSSAIQVLVNLYEAVQSPTNNQIAVVEPAEQGRPSNPQLQLRVLTAALAGLILTVPLIFAFEYLGGVIKRAEDITDVTVLGSIHAHPSLTGNDANALIIRTQPASEAAEDYRKLATQLFLSGLGRSPCSILLASIGDNQEIGDIAANLAGVLAQLGTEVVLIDANLRQPTLYDLFRLSARTGLVEMVDSHTLSLPAHSVEGLNGLSILPSGKTTEESFERLTSKAFVEVLETFKADNKLVMIIVPSLIDHAESLFLASRADNVILIAHKGSSTQRELQQTIGVLKTLRIQVAGVIFHHGRFGVPHSLRAQQRRVQETSGQNAVLANANRP